MDIKHAITLFDALSQETRLKAFRLLVKAGCTGLAAGALSERLGTPHNTLLETLGNASVTAHILGGCAIGAGPEDGVIDIDHQVFGHPGLFVTDAAAIPANVGVNPSLTIAALAERFSERFPARDGR